MIITMMMMMMMMIIMMMMMMMMMINLSCTFELCVIHNGIQNVAYNN